MPTWEDGDRAMDLISRGVCPLCGRRMEALPRTVLGARADARHRWAYDNYDCGPCGTKYSWLVKDLIPAGCA